LRQKLGFGDFYVFNLLEDYIV